GAGAGVRWPSGVWERGVGRVGGRGGAAPPAPAAPPPVPARRDDAEELGAEVGAAFGRVAAAARAHFGCSPEEARARAAEAGADRERLPALPPGQVSWFDLDRLGRLGPEAALRRWDAVKEAAPRAV